MLSVFVAAIYSAACVGLGSLVARLCMPRETQSVPVLFGLGCTMHGAAWILVALAGVLIPAVVWLSVLPLALFGGGRILAALQGGRSGASNISALFIVALLPVVCVFLWHALLAYYRPPFGDADAFYMVYPKIIARLGHLVPMGFVYHEFSSIGLSGEMHFSALMAIDSPVAAKLFAWAAALGTAFLLAELTGLVGGGRWAKLLAFSIFATSTTITDYMSDGKTELFPALIAMTAIVLIVRRPALVSTLAGGMLIGFLIGTMAYAKFSYIIGMLPTFFALILFFCLSQSNRVLSLISVGLITGGGFVLGLFPHLLKNWLLFGNPAAPFLGMSSNWTDQASWFSPADTAWIIATLPLSLAYGQYPLMGGNLSPIWLMALPFCIGAWQRKDVLADPLLRLTAAALLGLVTWLMLKPSIFAPRYFLVNLILLMPIVSIGVERYFAAAARSKAVVASFVGLSGIVVLNAPFIPPAGVWTATPKKIYEYARSEQHQCGLAISDYCSIFDEINSRLPSGPRVFLLGYYSFWLRDDLLLGLNSNEENLKVSTMPPSLWRYLSDREFGAVAVQTATHGRFLDYLRQSPVPADLEVKELFPDSNMPVFFIAKVAH